MTTRTARTARAARTARTAALAPRRLRRGVSLVEAVAVTTVVVVTVGSVAPGFAAMRERRHIEGLAAQLETDLMLARSEAVAQNRTLRMSFGADAGGSCYVVHSGAAQACSCGATGPVCSAGAAAFRSAYVAAASGLRVAANVRSMTIDPVRGTISPTSTMRVESDGGPAIHQVINIMGRVRSCSPAPALPGFKPC